MPPLSPIMSMDAYAFDSIQLLARLMLGAFFVLARFRFFCDPSRMPGDRWLCEARHTSLRNKLCHCGWSRLPYGWAWVTAIVEVAAGIAVIVGFLTTLAAFGLLIITVCATYCTFRDKVIIKQRPVDKLDVCSCYLWTVEPLYILLSVIVLIGGPGYYSVDAYVW